MIEVSTSFGGDSSEWMRMAEILGTTSGALEVDGMARHVPRFVAGELSDPHGFREARAFDEHSVCPVAYALAREGGWDPVAALVLGEIRCDVTIRDARCPWSIEPQSEGGHVDLDAVVGRGILWRSGIAGGQCLHIHPVDAGLPDAVMVHLSGEGAGRALSTIVSHPVLDPHRFRVEGVAAIENAAGRTMFWNVNLANPPARIALEEAVGRHG